MAKKLAVTEFRIVTNGLVYRLQYFGKVNWLSRNKWRWVCRLHPEGEYIPDFNSKEEAEKAMERAKKCFEAKERGWQPI